MSLPKDIDGVIDKINTLSNLPKDWDSYGAPPIDRKVLLIACAVLARLVGLPYPWIVPMVNGGICLEWHFNQRDIEVEITSEDTVDNVIAKIEKAEIASLRRIKP